MSLQVSWRNVFACVLVVALLSACQKSPSGAVIVQIPPEGPKEVVVTSAPLPEPASAQPEQIPVNRIPSNVLPREEPQVIVIPENRPAEDPVADCIEKCKLSCETSANFACSKPSGADCRSGCGQIIDPSACSTACSLRSARICEPKFIEFCSAQCVGKCY
ncbi:MAG: hypothetical protein QXT19_02735 [Candidatus Woesearchaeota archaeon]